MTDCGLYTLADVAEEKGLNLTTLQVRKCREKYRKANRRYMEIRRHGCFYISVREDDGLYYVKKVGLSKSEAHEIAAGLNAFGIPAHYRPHISEQMKINGAGEAK